MTLILIVLGLYRLTLLSWRKKSWRWHKLLWNFPGYQGHAELGRRAGGVKGVKYFKEIQSQEGFQIGSSAKFITRA